MAKTITSGLVRASLFILIAYGIFYAANFLYHLLSARMLGPAEYSVVASLFSIIYLVGIASTSIQNAVTKFTADFKARNEKSKIAYLFRHGLNKIFLYSLIILALYLLISPLIASFLKIPLISALTMGPIIIFSAVISINRGILQGLQDFKNLGVNMIIEGLAKFALAFILIYLGFKANGVISAASIAMALAFALTFPYLKFGKIERKFDSKEIYKFSYLALAALFLLSAIYSLDIFLVKHFFSAEAAGQYAALSLFGKVIFFGATSIGLVMFPKVSEMNYKDRKKMSIIFRESILFTLLISAIITIVYFLLSKPIVNLVFGPNYAGAIPLLGLFGIFMSLVSLSYICILNKLAIGKKKFILNLLAAVILEILLICFFHGSLSQILTILIIINSILLISLLKQ